MRCCLLLVALSVLPGCGPSAEAQEKVEEVAEYLLRVVDAQERYITANSTYSLNMRDLIAFDESLAEQPEGYTFKGGGGLALAFGYEVLATPESSGPHLYVNTSGVVRVSYRGPADHESQPVD